MTASNIDILLVEDECTMAEPTATSLGQNGMRYSVLYVWDLDGHSTIGQVTEFDLG